MRCVRVIAGLLILGGAVLCLAHVALAGDAASKTSEAATSKSSAATSQPDRAGALEKEVEELKREVLVLRRMNADLTQREMAWLEQIAELRRQLAHRPVLRILPDQQSGIVQPAPPKGAIRREFNGEPFYLIPLE